MQRKKMWKWKNIEIWVGLDKIQTLTFLHLIFHITLVMYKSQKLEEPDDFLLIVISYFSIGPILCFYGFIKKISCVVYNHSKFINVLLFSMGPFKLFLLIFQLNFPLLSLQQQETVKNDNLQVLIQLIQKERQTHQKNREMAIQLR